MGIEIQVNTLEEMCDLMCSEPEKEPITRFEKWKQAADIQKTLDETVKSMGLREELQKWAEESDLCCCM